MNSKAVLFLAMFSAAILTSCYKTDDFSNMADSEWSPDFSVPLVNADLTVNDIFLKKDSPEKIVINDKNIVEVYYRSDNYSAMAGDLLSLPEANETGAFSLSVANTELINQGNIGTQVADSLILQVDYPLGGQGSANARPDSVWLKDGILIASLQSTISQTISFVLSIPGATLNGVPFRKSAQLVPAGSGGNAQIEVALAGYVFDLTPQHKLEVHLIANVEKTSSQAIGASGHFNTTLSLKDQEFRKISGYFPELEMPVVTNDTLFLRIFKNALSADILDFEDPSAKITFQNSTGIPLKSSLNAFAGFRPGGVIPPLNLSGTNYPVDVPAQTEGGNPGRFDINFTPGNGSNIENVVNSFPRYMTNQTNHALQHGTDPSVRHFVYDTSRVHVYAEVRLPLDGLTLNLSLLDTFNLEFTEIADEVERVMIRVIINNGFPSDGNLQVYFCKDGQDQDGNPVFATLDSLYSGARPVLKSGIVNPANGKVIQPSLSIEDGYLTGDQWKALRAAGANRIRIRSRLTTYDGGNELVKVYEDNRLNIKISAQFKIKTSF
jgi:hypothetical protein